MNMKKLIVTACVILSSVVSIAQTKTLVAKIENNKTSFTQNPTGSITKFELTATADQIKNLKNQAAEISDKMQFVATLKAEGVYSCVLTITHQNHAEYVHKMFVYLGIKEITIDGKNKSVDDLSEVLKSLK